MGFQGSFDGKDTATNAKLRIRLDADRGDVLVGGDGTGGDLSIVNDTNETKIRLDAGGAEPPPPPSTGPHPGGPPAAGLITETIVLSGASGSISLGGAGQTGGFTLKGSTGKEGILLTGAGHAYVGGTEADGYAIVRSKDGQQVKVDSRQGVLLTNSAGETLVQLRAEGDGPSSTTRVFIDGKNGNLTLGGHQTNGDLFLLDTAGQTRIRLDAQDGGHIKLMAASGELRVHIDGDAGDIVLPNADCAEDFDLAGRQPCAPGTVMVIDDDGRLRQSDAAYDRRVAGVLSGAGDLRPGLILGRRPSRGNRQPLALAGTVFCRVDADHGPIGVGDLLTTSPTPGHAMKASDPHRSFGTVIGKALRPLAGGRALIPVLVALQ
jgi:hypothetical protein